MVTSLGRFLYLLAALACAIVAFAQQPNDNFANRIPVEPSVPFDASLTGAAVEPLDPLSAYTYFSNANLGSVWWTWTPDATGFATIIDTKNDFPYVDSDALAVYQGDDLASLHDPVWVYVSPSYPPQFGPKAFLGFPTTAGQPLSIGLVGNATRAFTHNFLITFSETPIIIEPPTSKTNNAGGAVAFHFTSPSYRFGHTQWQFKSQDIPDATNAVLFLSDIRPSHAGEYRVIIEATNSAGVLKRTVSPAATLTVVGDVTPPTLSFQLAPDSPSDLLLNIFGTTNQWYSVYSTIDFKKWTPVEIPFPAKANTVIAGQTLIKQLADAEYLRVQHRGNLEEVCIQNLLQIHFAKELHRFANHRRIGDAIYVDDLKQFLGELPRCPQAGMYTYGPIDTQPVCSWSAYGHNLRGGVIWP